jgi:hypothetical protein
MGEFILQKEGKIEYFQVKPFLKTGLVKHAFTGKSGGVSEGDFSGLNLAFHTGDDPEKVLMNRQLICAALKINPLNLVVPSQVHGDRVVAVNPEHIGMGAISHTSGIGEADGLVTNYPEIPLMTCYADCVPIMFLDPVKKAIGLSHAGWKGTVKRIGSKTVQAMKKHFNSKLGDILVAIAPAIGPCCYRVKDDVFNMFQGSFGNWNDFLEPAGDNSWALDLKKANVQDLLEAGIPKENITISEICTSCCNLLFSYRRDGGRTGRQGAVLMLIGDGGKK